ncbi:MAG: MBL fold metallo-hydrolase [Thermodesulfobacteriota bacterium]
MAYRGIIPGIHPLKELAQSRVMEIAPGIWNVEGYFGQNFLFRPPSSNCFVLHDRDLALLVDTGTYPFYRKPMLDLLARLRKSGARRLRLMLTQGHFDHVANNDLILEAGYDDVEFLLPEEEVTTLDLFSHWTGELDELGRYYNPFRAMPLAFPTALPNLASRISPKLARSMMHRNLRALFAGVNTMAGRAKILTAKTKVTKTFGQATLSGWEVGRFFAVHDATHSPGHLSFYDPEHKVFLTGDATLEINPAFFNSSVENCILMMDRFQKMAQAGAVLLATDSHRSSIWTQRLMDSTGEGPVHPFQVVDQVEGAENCAEFYRFFGEYYTACRDAVLSALSRLGEATVFDLMEEFRADKNPCVHLKSLLGLPAIPSRLDVLVAKVLAEGKAARREENGRILFSPAES